MKCAVLRSHMSPEWSTSLHLISKTRLDNIINSVIFHLFYCSLIFLLSEFNRRETFSTLFREDYSAQSGNREVANLVKCDPILMRCVSLLTSIALITSFIDFLGMSPGQLPLPPNRCFASTSILPWYDLNAFYYFILLYIISFCFIVFWFILFYFVLLYCILFYFLGVPLERASVWNRGEGNNLNFSSNLKKKIIYMRGGLNRKE